MDDQTFELISLRIETIFQNLREALGLKKVRFKLAIIREAPPDDHHGDGGQVTAMMLPNWEYSTSVLQVYAASLRDVDDEELSFILLHEIMHYMVHPISRYGQGNHESDILEEKVCTEVALMVISAMEQSVKEVGNHWRSEVKKLQRELKKLQKEKVA